jgi:hypothetical protein
MFAYAPEDMPPKAPLVIALHGCTQTSDEYDHGTGWSSLADSLGFAVVYPQQQPANNPKNCFSWFLLGDIARGHGEAHNHTRSQERRPQAPSRAVVQANTPFRRGNVGSFALAPIVLSLEAALSLSFCLDCAADARPLAQ